MRIDSLIQGAGCLTMGGASALAVYTLGSSVEAPILVGVVSCLWPCCLLCGALACCTGLNAPFAAPLSKLRCDGLALDEDDDNGRTV